MELFDLRYIFEHQMMVDYYYTYGGKFVMALLNTKKPFIFDVFSDMCNKENVKMPYSKQDFIPELHDLGDTKMLVQPMPKPEEALLCQYIFLVFNAKVENCVYFTCELVEDNKYCLCSWDKNKRHNNYGLCPTGKREIISQILKHYNPSITKDNSNLQ